MTRSGSTSTGGNRRAPLPFSIETVAAELEQAPRGDLADRWRSIYRCNPPKGVGRRLLIGAIAHELQLWQAGRKRKSILRRLEQRTAAISRGSSASTPPLKLKPGARLIRDWNGSTHSVDVVEDGYVWNGERYRSLSAIARAITGAQWSGPRFFGLDRDGAR